MTPQRCRHEVPVRVVRGRRRPGLRARRRGLFPPPLPFPFFNAPPEIRNSDMFPYRRSRRSRHPCSSETSPVVSTASACDLLPPPARALANTTPPLSGCSPQGGRGGRRAGRQGGRAPPHLRWRRGDEEAVPLPGRHLHRPQRLLRRLPHQRKVGPDRGPLRRWVSAGLRTMIPTIKTEHENSDGNLHCFSSVAPYGTCCWAARRASPPCRLAERRTSPAAATCTPSTTRSASSTTWASSSSCAPPPSAVSTAAVHH